MSVFIALPLLLGAAIAQVTILPELRLLDSQPDLVILIVMAWALRAERLDAVIWAVIGAIFQDLLTPAIPLGFSLLALLPSIFMMQELERHYYGLGWLALLGLVVIVTLLHHGLIYGYFALTGFAANPGLFASQVLFPTIGLNLAGIFPIYWTLRRIQKRLPKSQSAWRVSNQNE